MVLKNKKRCSNCDGADQRATHLLNQNDELRRQVFAARETVADLHVRLEDLKKDRDALGGHLRVEVEGEKASRVSAVARAEVLEQKLFAMIDRGNEARENLIQAEADILRQREALTDLTVIQNMALNFGMNFHQQDFLGAKAWRDLTWREKRYLLRTVQVWEQGTITRLRSQAWALTRKIAQFQTDVACRVKRKP